METPVLILTALISVILSFGVVYFAIKSSIGEDISKIRYYMYRIALKNGAVDEDKQEEKTITDNDTK